MKSVSVSLVLPTYNEAGHIQDLLNSCISNLRMPFVSNFEIIVVDDDSPDETWRIVQEFSSSDADIKCIRRVENRGLVNSLQEGISACKNDVVIWMDADFSHPPECIPQLIYMIVAGFDVVVNSRYIFGGGEDRCGKGSSTQLFLSKILNTVVRVILRHRFNDYTSGFIAIKRRLLTENKLVGDYGEYFIALLYRLLCNKSLRVCELPYFALPRRTGISKTGSQIIDYIRVGHKYIVIAIMLRLGLK